MGELSLSIADQLAKSFDQAWLLFKEVSDGLSFDFQEVNFADAVNGCTAGGPCENSHFSKDVPALELRDFESIM